MTAPLSWTSPAPVEAAPPLVVRPERRKVRRLFAIILVANGFMAVVSLVAALWVSSATGEWWAGAALSVTSAGAVFQMVFHAYYYGRMMATSSIAEIGPDGIRGRTTRWAEQTLPWSSVASVSRGWNSVVVSPVAGAGPKVLIPTRAIDTDTATIRAAIHHFSGARL